VAALNQFSVRRLVDTKASLSQELLYNLAVIDSEQSLIFDIVLEIATFALEKDCHWASFLLAGLDEISRGLYDDPRCYPTFIHLFGTVIKSFALSKGTQAWELLVRMFQEPRVCRADNLKISEFYAWAYDPSVSVLSNMATLDKLQESTRNSVLPSHHALLGDSYAISVLLGNLFEGGLFDQPIDNIAVQRLKEAVSGNPALLTDKRALRAELENHMQGNALRGSGVSTASANSFVAAVPPRPSKQTPPGPSRQGASGFRSNGPTQGSAPLASASPAQGSGPQAQGGSLAKGSKSSKGGVNAGHHGGSSGPAPDSFSRQATQGTQEAPFVDHASLSQEQRLDFYFHAVPLVRDFFGLVKIPLTMYLEAVAVKGKPTHRWVLDKKDSNRPRFLRPEHLALAKEFQASGAGPHNLCQLLIAVKMAREKGDFYIGEVNDKARVMATFAPTKAKPVPDFHAMLQADVPAQAPPRGKKARPRSAEVEALAAGVRDLDFESDPAPDDASSLSRSTANFADVFSGGAHAAPGSSEGASSASQGPALSKSQKKAAKKAAKKALAQDEHLSAAERTAMLLSGSHSKDAPGSAQADPWGPL
jgi:hypothetical protein